MKKNLFKILMFVFAPFFVLAISFGGVLFQKNNSTPNSITQENNVEYNWSEALASGFSVSDTGIYDVAETESVLIDLSEGVVPGSDTGATLTRTTIEDEKEMPTNMLRAELVDGQVEVVIRANGKDHYISASTDAEYVLGDLLTGGRTVVASGTKFYVADTKGSASLARTSLDGTGVAQTAAAYTTSDARLAYITSGTFVFDGKNNTYYGGTGTGRAFYAKDCTITIKNATLDGFNNNNSQVVYIVRSTITIDRLNVYNCRTNATLYLDTSTTANVTNCNLKDNLYYNDTTATSIAVSCRGSGTYTFSNCIIGDASATSTATAASHSEGCAFSLGDTVTVNITNCTIAKCYSWGGTIYINNGQTLNMTNTDMLYNASVHEGGCIKYYGGNITINGGTFAGNYGTDGGFLRTESNSAGTINVNDATISNNSAAYGGAISNIWSAAHIEFNDCDFDGNFCTGTGGGSTIYTFGKMFLNNCDVEGTSTQKQSAIYNGNANGHGTLVAANSEVQETAETSGSGATNQALYGSTYYTCVNFNIASKSYFTSGNKYAIYLSGLELNYLREVKFANGWGDSIVSENYSTFGVSNLFQQNYTNYNVSFNSTVNGSFKRVSTGSLYIEFTANSYTNSQKLWLIYANSNINYVPAASLDLLRAVHVDIFDITNGVPSMIVMNGTSVHDCTTTGAGGALHNTGNSVANLFNCTFDGNTASNNGGAITNGGTLSIYGGTISNNTTTGNHMAGAIYTWTSSKVELNGNVTITGNSAPDYYGGAISNNTGCVINIYSATFSLNSAKNSGAAIANYGTVNMYGGTITTSSNTAGGGHAFWCNNASCIVNMSGGSISGNNCAGVNVCAGATFNMTGGTISGNVMPSSGAGIVSYGTTNISGGTISGNTAQTYDGGGIYAGGGTLNISGTALIGANESSVADPSHYSNIARYGGAIYVTGGTVANIIGGTIAYNYAKSSGGAIYVSNSTGNQLNITGGTIKCNCSPNGGAIYNHTSTVTMSGGTISGNSTTYDGGGINNSGTLTISGTAIISGNTASRNGGGIHSIGTTTISGGTISGNTASNGGGIYATATVALSNSAEIISNTANGQGGGGIAMYGSSAVLNMTGGHVGWTNAGNTAAQAGGGIACQNGATLNLSGGSVLRNSAPIGGGIYSASATDRINISGTATIGYNQATVYSAGGVYCTGILNMTGGEVGRNAANSTTGGYGGGIMIKTTSNNGATNRIIGGNIMYNTAALDGGGIKVDGSLTIAGTVNIGRNEAKNGGGIAVNSNATLDLDSSAITVSQNTASGSGGGYGGGLYGYGSCLITMTDGSVSGNTANKGGGVYLSSGAELDLDGGSISNNTASAEGGGIKTYAGIVYISGGEISSNSANKGGAVYYHYGSPDDSNLYLNGEVSMSNNSSTVSGADQFALASDAFFNVNYQITTDYNVWREAYYTIDNTGTDSMFTHAKSTNATYRTSAYEHLKPTNMPANVQLDNGNRKANCVVFISIGTFTINGSGNTASIPIVVGATVTITGTHHECDGFGYYDKFDSITITSDTLTLVNGEYVYPTATLTVPNLSYAFNNDCYGEEFGFDGSQGSGGIIKMMDLDNGYDYSIDPNVGEVVLDFYDTRITYTITYKANGGSGSDATQTVYYQQSFTTKPSSTFTYKHTTFNSWSTSSSSNSGNYKNANTSYTYANKGNITLYAIWKIEITGTSLMSYTGTRILYTRHYMKLATAARPATGDSAGIAQSLTLYSYNIAYFNWAYEQRTRFVPTIDHYTVYLHFCDTQVSSSSGVVDSSTSGLYTTISASGYITRTFAQMVADKAASQTQSGSGISGTMVFYSYSPYSYFVSTSSTLKQLSLDVTTHRDSSSSFYRLILDGSIETDTANINQTGGMVLLYTEEYVFPSGASFSTSGAVLTVGVQKFTAVPIDGYEFVSWTLSDGGSIASSYSADVSIKANFGVQSASASASISEKGITGLASYDTEKQTEHAETAWFDDKHRKLSKLGIELETAEGDVDGLAV